MSKHKIPADYAVPGHLLAERVILVTGAGDGIGKAVSLACAAHGATVILLGRTGAKREAVYDAVTAAGQVIGFAELVQHA